MPENKTSSSQQEVIVHLDNFIGSTTLTNFYRATISKFKINSTIIVNDNIAISNELIHHTNSSDQSIPQLLYRGTRDGFKSEDFHSRCDNQGPTLTIIKSEHNQIFGGFTTQSWISPSPYGKYISDSSAFLFKIETNSNNTTDDNRNVYHHQQLFRKFNIKLGKEANAIFSITSCLPIFGAGFDIRICSDCNLNCSYSDFGGSYELPTATGNDDDEFQRGSEKANRYLAGSPIFKVLEIEVFKITTIQQEQ